MNQSDSTELSSGAAIIAKRVWQITSVLTLALALWLLFILTVPASPMSDFAEYDRLAWSVAQGQGYIDTAGHPTAYRPPGYPLTLAAIYAAFGHVTLLARLFNALVDTGICGLIFTIASCLGSRSWALLAASTYALYPSAIYYTNLLAGEPLFTAGLVLTVYLLLRLLARRSDRLSAAR